MKLRFLSIVACLFLLSGMQFSSLHAQNTGTIEGTVTDTNGQPLASVPVQLTSPVTDQKWTTTTDSGGFYRFSNIPVGRYRLTTGTPGQGVVTGAGAPVGTAPGNVTATEYEATAGGPVVVNLKVATPRTDNIISAEAVPIQTNPAQIQHIYNTARAEYWPRSNWMSKTGEFFGAYNDILISEGITSGDVLAVGPAVGGQPPYGNNFRIDGVDNNNKVVPGPLVYVSNFATDSTNFFHNQAVPIFGHSIGGQTDLIKRSGTNDFHGAIYDFIQWSNLNATDQAVVRSGNTSNPSYTQNRLGGSIGFPIMRNKVFFFGNFEYVPLNANRLTSGAVLAPTTAGFATLGTVPGVSATNLGVLQTAITSVPTQQAATTTVGGTTIPLGFSDLFVKDSIRRYFGSGGFDITVGASDNVHILYAHNRINSNNLGTAFESTLPAFQTPTNLTALLANVSEIHTFGSGALNELRLAYNRWARTISGVSQSFPGFASFPSIGISGSTNLLIGPSPIARSSRFNTYQISDVFGWHRGRHRFDFGMDALRYIGAVTNNPAFGGGGIFGFSSFDRFLRDLPPDVQALQGFGTGRVDDTRYLWEWFIQDNWQMRSNLLITLGVRYQYNTSPQALQEQKLNAIADVPGVISFTDPDTQKTAVAPYVGFAWSPMGSTKTVVRGGFGIHYQSLLNRQLELPFTTFAPEVGALIAGTNLGNTPGFLAGGGIAAPATPSPALTQSQARSLTTAFAQKQTLPYSMQYQFAIQRAVWSGFTAELKYLGSRDVHLPFLTTLNSPSATPTAGFPIFTSAPSQDALNALPTLQSSQSQALTAAGFTNQVFTVQPVGLSRYNAAAVNLSQRLSGGLQFLANYTWSHDYATSTGSMLDLVFGRTLADTPWDRRHHASIGAVYDFGTVFKNYGAVVRNVFANFVLSGGYIYEWPARLSLLSLPGVNTNGLGVAPVVINSAGTTGATSPVTPLTNSAGQTVAFLATDPSASFFTGAPGVSGAARNAIDLSPINNLNLSAVKRFSYKDRAAVEVRADAFNIANHPQFTFAPITGLASTSFGLVPNFISGQSPVVPNVSIPGSTTFSDPTKFFSTNPRVLQLSLRVTW